MMLCNVGRDITKNSLVSANKLNYTDLTSTCKAADDATVSY